MSGSFDSVIGLRPAEVVKKYLTRRPQATQVAKENPGVSCVVIQINDQGKATAIERLRYSVAPAGWEQEKEWE